MRNIKRELYDLCQAHLHQRIMTAKQAIAESQEAANNETKSSSGDKYETGRAMMQLQIEKDSVQLSETLKLKHALDQIRIDNVTEAVQRGSLVETNNGVFFIAISVGKLTLGDRSYLVISPASPIALKMVGLKEKESFTLKDRTYRILKIS